MIRIVVVDDQEVVRIGLRTLAEHDDDIRVVAEAATGRAGVNAVREHVPDVVLMDIRMPGMDGLEATREIVDDPALQTVRVAILTTFDEDENVLTAIRYGAAGYLLKDIAPIELRAAIRAVAAGDALLSPSVTTTVMRKLTTGSWRSRPELLARLTDREREVLARVAVGETNDEIGASLHLSPATARTYVSRLMQKLSARDRVQLVIIGYESGLVAPGAEEAPRRHRPESRT
jgi:DNA-binding NarL/FixJ family response regulator